MRKTKSIKLLDLYCKAGGASMGYYQAAKDLKIPIEIVGVDKDHQKNYPFDFIQSDAIDFIKVNHTEYTHIHASPPCQKYSRSTKQYRDRGKIYPDLIDITREWLEVSGLPAIIENVPGSPVKKDIILRGDVFGLDVIRRRWFETINWFMLCPFLPKLQGSVKEGDYACVFGNTKSRGRKNYKPYKKIKGTILESWKKAMGIDWMNNEEISESIPPAYTRYIGYEFLKQ